jgi:pyruvate formate-lyase/glycerol dehydratase family glycyl radical enzyme
MTISVTQTTTKRMPASDRIMRLKERLLSSSWEVDLERARYYTRTWKKMESAPAAMRAAQALKETFQNMTIRIEDDELLVGVKTGKNFAGSLGIERHLPSIAIQLAILLRGKKRDDIDPFLLYVGGHSKEFDREIYNMPEEVYRELKEEILPYWQGKDLKSMKLALWKKRGIDMDTTEIAHVLEMQGHIIIGLKRVLDVGFKGISEWAGKTLKSLKESDRDYQQRKEFLESVRVAAEAVCDLSNRYAALAEKMAEKAEGQRKTELLQIAERCKHVPANPPRNFIEALQSVWMTQVALIISYGDDAIQGPGRLDQLLYPYYKHELETGAVTRESAQELLEEYLIKVSYFTMFGPNNITIGGVDQNGEDATNDLSYLFLDANDALKGGLRKSFAVRISPKTPRDFLKRACETYRIGAGVAFYNDNVVIRDLLEDGYSLADARNYSIVGCAEPTGMGNNNGYTGSNGVFITQVLEIALNEGKRLRDGKKVGASTPDPRTFTTFEDVKEAFVGQLSYLIDAVVREAELKDQLIAKYFPSPLLSSTIEGCVESGRDISQEGARYSHSHVGAQGLATVVNSLSAIRWAVFEEKILTMEEMATHLRNNFADAENIRQMLLRKAPKYGNDDPRADELAEWVTQVHAREVRRHKSGVMGGYYRPLMISAGTQDTEGVLCGASADGRLAKAAVANGMSPANGTELNGATAALHSVARASKACFSSGTSLNMNLSPGLIKTDEGLDKLASMIEAYFILGGRQIQINPVDVNTLKDAQLHPENYADLTVKVSGYSFRFIDLSKSLQDDIIARTQFSEV